MAKKELNKSAHPHGTLEWAVTNVNLQTGCEHDCRYCYAKSMGIRFKRTTPESWSKPVPQEAALTKNYGKKREGRIMFPSSHDITMLNVDVCLTVLKKLLEAGNDVLIVMKPDPECVKRLCDGLKMHKAQILFRFTIGSADDKVLTFWEPHAPCFAERITSLKMAYDAGFETSVSCEPMLDGNAGAVIKAASPYTTDSIWLGMANHLLQMVGVNCPGDAKAKQEAQKINGLQNDVAIRALYAAHKGNPLIKWKDSIKKVVGLARPKASGLDI